MKPFTIVCAFAIIAGTSALIWHTRRQCEQTEKATLTLKGDLGTIANERARTAAELSRAIRERDAYRVELGNEQQSAAQSARKVAESTPTLLSRRPSSEQIDQRVASDPKLQLSILATEKAQLPVKYGPFYRMHGVTPERASALEDLLMERFEAGLDLVGIERTQGPLSKEIADKTRAEFRTAIAGLLGEEGARTFRKFERTTSLRRSVIQPFAGQLALAGQPISLQQGELLTEALASTSPRYQKGGPASTDTVDWTAAKARVQGVLTPEQSSVFDYMVQEREATARLRSQLNEWAKAKSRNEAPAAK